MKRILLLFVASGLLLLIAGCGESGYYLQSVSGHLAVMAQRRPIRKLLVDPQTEPALRQRLERVLAIRDFAVTDLHLPDNDSFLTYADIGRDHVVWNVVAAPADSLAPLTWRFPFAGRVPYRGYFQAKQAESYAGRLRADGYDVHVYGVQAYSTLGWFADPVLNTFIDLPDWMLAQVLVHELAHQLLYVEDDADFNEAFAQTVMEEGGRRWLDRHGSDDDRARAERFRRIQADFSTLVRRTRAALGECYVCETSHAAKLACKASVLAGMRDDYAGLKGQWGGYAGYDDWFETDLNNARFVSEATYYRLLPAFNRLLRRESGDMVRFYQAAQELAARPAAERAAALNALLVPGG